MRRARESRSTRAAAQQVGIRETLLSRWQRAQAAAEAGSAAQAQAPAWRALRADTQRRQRALAGLKKALASCLL